MPRTRLYTDHPLRPGNEVTLDGDRAKYVSRVLRLRPDEEILLFNGDGFDYPSVVRTVGKAVVTVAVGDARENPSESPLALHLVQGISRGERMDFVMQKSTELGVTRITPVLTEYSVVKLDAKRAGKRVAHWRGVAASACEQSGRSMLPEVESPLPLRDWLGANLATGGTRLVLKPGWPAQLGATDLSGDSMTVRVGPEGGFSDQEYERAGAAGFLPVGFGPRVLRTETAALSILAALQTLRGDLG